MENRIWLPWAAKLRGGEAVKAMVAQFQPRMLTGNEQLRRLAKVGKGVGDRA
jgi:hypothetical protein